jgi:hypothetical protein
MGNLVRLNDLPIDATDILGVFSFNLVLIMIFDLLEIVESCSWFRLGCHVAVFENL